MPHSPAGWFRSKTTFLFVATLAVQAGSAATIFSESALFLGNYSDPLYNIDVQNSDGDSFASDSFGSASEGRQLTGDALAMPGYTQLRVASSASFSITGTPSNAWSGAFAESIDSITVTSPALNGLPGRFSLSYALDGTMLTSGAGNSIIEVGIGQYWASYTSLTSGTFRVPQDFTFVFGQPFGVSLCLGSLTGAGLSPSGGFQEGNSHVSTFLCAPNANPTIGSGSAAADFTLRLLPLLVTDTLGNPVPDAQFTSASVPEGSSLLMLASGLTTLVLLRLATPEYSLSRLTSFRRTIQVHWLQKVASSDRRPRAKTNL